MIPLPHGVLKGKDQYVFAPYFSFLSAYFYTNLLGTPSSAFIEPVVNALAYPPESRFSRGILTRWELKPTVLNGLLFTFHAFFKPDITRHRTEWRRRKAVKQAL